MPGLRGLLVAEFVQPLVVNPEVVGNLVQDGDAHLFRDVSRMKGPLKRTLEDDDTVGQGQVVVGALGERGADVEAEQRVAVLGGFEVIAGWLALDRDLDVVELAERRGR